MKLAKWSALLKLTPLKRIADNMIKLPAGTASVPLPSNGWLCQDHGCPFRQSSLMDIMLPLQNPRSCLSSIRRMLSHSRQQACLTRSRILLSNTMHFISVTSAFAIAFAGGGIISFSSDSYHLKNQFCTLSTFVGRDVEPQCLICCILQLLY